MLHRPASLVAPPPRFARARKGSQLEMFHFASFPHLHLRAIRPKEPLRAEFHSRTSQTILLNVVKHHCRNNLKNVPRALLQRDQVAHNCQCKRSLCQVARHPLGQVAPRLDPPNTRTAWLLNEDQHHVGCPLAACTSANFANREQDHSTGVAQRDGKGLMYRKMLRRHRQWMMNFERKYCSLSTRLCHKSQILAADFRYTAPYADSVLDCCLRTRCSWSCACWPARHCTTKIPNHPTCSTM
mmetsp:Transcript_153838/g.271510  ORF Transcript_153838/g.271510 Transcript_153838/m.271510 type:complete len:241 (+) Transcript_153838:843-1565(+)